MGYGGCCEGTRKAWGGGEGRGRGCGDVSVVVVIDALQKAFDLLQKPEKIQLTPHMPKKPFLSLPKNNSPFIPIVPPPPPPPPTNTPPSLPLSFSFLLNHLTPLYYTTTPPHNLSSPPKKTPRTMRDLILPTLILIALFLIISTILTSPRGLEYVTKGFSLVVMVCLIVMVWIQWRAIEVITA